jgi:ABC-type multidrug transport system permease subunit
MPMISTLILYWMIGLSNTAEQFFTFYFVLFLVGFAGSSVGLLLGSLIKDAKLVADSISLVIVPFVLFSGFVKNREDLPRWAFWL